MFGVAIVRSRAQAARPYYSSIKMGVGTHLCLGSAPRIPRPYRPYFVITAKEYLYDNRQILLEPRARRFSARIPPVKRHKGSFRGPFASRLTTSAHPVLCTLSSIPVTNTIVSVTIPQRVALLARAALRGGCKSGKSRTISFSSFPLSSKNVAKKKPTLL